MKIIDVGQEAHGFIAIGQMATGFFALGQIATGVIAIGQAARGFIAIGQVSLGLVSVGMGAGGTFWSLAMFGVAGRGLGLVLPLAPSGRKALGPPEASPSIAVLSGTDAGWVSARLVRKDRGLFELVGDEGTLPALLSARLRRSADALTRNGDRDVYAHLEPRGDDWVATRLMVDPDEVPNPMQPLMMLPLQFAALVVVNFFFDVYDWRYSAADPLGFHVQLDRAASGSGNKEWMGLGANGAFINLQYLTVGDYQGGEPIQFDQDGTDHMVIYTPTRGGGHPITCRLAK